ncbi:MAG: cytochrome b/b6 domain-containing protein [Pseudomonadota bacterium]
MTQRKIAIWDWPVRLTHWGFALLIPAMWWTAENGEMGWHMRLGLVLLALVLFRIFWGFVGSDTARFANFVRSPMAALADLLGRRKQGVNAIGHSPSGAWSVVFLLTAMLAQVGLGLFAGDPYDGATGPLNSLVGVMTADTLTEWHETFFWVLVGLIALHLIAVLLYQTIGGQKLVGPMITGSRASDAPISGNKGGSAVRAFACLLLAVAIAGLIGSGLAEQFLSG